MGTLTFGNTAFAVDKDGFLANTDDWTPQLAAELAAQTGIQLNEQHWRVITFCREDQLKTGKSPGLRRIAKNSGVPMKELYKLFPKGPGKLAAKIAGIPKPKSCV